MTDLFDCPYCDYKGSEAWTHLMKNHIGIRDQWDPNRAPKQKTLKVNDDELVAGDQPMSGKMTIIQPMHKITRRLEFDAGHRVYQHESKCNHIHGHRYVVEVECTGSLDSLGRIVDFSVIKTKFGKWIDDNLDHGMILFSDDPLAKLWNCFGQKLATDAATYPVGHLVEDASAQKHFVMDKNPTAENLAELLYRQANEMLADDGFTVTKITVHETPNCKAEYSEQ